MTIQHIQGSTVSTSNGSSINLTFTTAPATSNLVVLTVGGYYGSGPRHGSGA